MNIIHYYCSGLLEVPVCKNLGRFQWELDYNKLELEHFLLFGFGSFREKYEKIILFVSLLRTNLRNL